MLGDMVAMLEVMHHPFAGRQQDTGVLVSIQRTAEVDAFEVDKVHRVNMDHECLLCRCLHDLATLPMPCNQPVMLYCITKWRAESGTTCSRCQVNMHDWVGPQSAMLAERRSTASALFAPRGLEPAAARDPRLALREGLRGAGWCLPTLPLLASIAIPDAKDDCPPINELLIAIEIVPRVLVACPLTLPNTPGKHQQKTERRKHRATTRGTVPDLTPDTEVDELHWNHIRPLMKEHWPVGKRDSDGNPIPKNYKMEMAIALLKQTQAEMRLTGKDGAKVLRRDKMKPAPKLRRVVSKRTVRKPSAP